MPPTADLRSTRPHCALILSGLPKGGDRIRAFHPRSDLNLPLSTRPAIKRLLRHGLDDAHGLRRGFGNNTRD